MNAVAALWHRVPVGESEGRAFGVRWRAARTVLAGGRSEKIVAEALDGSGFVSCNLYRPAAGPRVAPCEMPEARVLAFLEAYEPRREGAAPVPRRGPREP
ncbi:MAG: hypothetical protein ACU0BS_08405 [Hasllibacter sp.]